MIRIIKKPKPQLLEDKETEWIQEFLAADRQERKKNKYHQRYKQFKSLLLEESFEKCAYCESKILATYPGDVEHIHPKSIVPEKIYSWENLTVSCYACNNSKSDYFDQSLPLINPIQDDPEQFIVGFGPYVSEKNGQRQGEITIKTLELNRINLLEKRKEKIDKINDLLKVFLYSQSATDRKVAALELKQQLGTEKEYNFVVKQYICKKCNKQQLRLLGII